MKNHKRKIITYLSNQNEVSREIWNYFLLNKHCCEYIKLKTFAW